jgi:hypothetical protein
MKGKVSVVKLCLYVSECACSKIIKELLGLVGSGTPYISTAKRLRYAYITYLVGFPLQLQELLLQYGCIHCDCTPLSFAAVCTERETQSTIR